MPKKQPRNAFYFYMHDFREEQRKKGVNYANMAEVAEAAGPLWKDAPPSVRTKFEEKAKKEKQKYNVPEMKYTSTGISYAEIERQEKEARDAEAFELQDIKNMVKLKCFNGAIVHEDFYIMDVNFYCKINNEYIIAESTVLRFNLQDGIKDQYHEIITPGKIPTGYAYDVKLGCEALGLEMPDEAQKKSNYFQILANVIDYLKQKDRDSKNMPPLYTMAEKLEPVRSFIQQMCCRAAEDDSIFRVYNLEKLFFILINALRTRHDEGFPRESLSKVQLKKDMFKYTTGIGCKIHEEVDKSDVCTSSRAKRWAYTMMDSCCPVAGIELRPGSHLPGDYDVEGIYVYKEQKKERSAPSVAGTSGRRASSSNVSTVSEPFIDAAAMSTVEYPKKEKRTHEPLRMPKKDWSQTIHVAPELTEDNFPSLSSGAGRGRGMSASLKKLNIKK